MNGNHRLCSEELPWMKEFQKNPALSALIARGYNGKGLNVQLKFQFYSGYHRFRPAPVISSSLCTAGSAETLDGAAVVGRGEHLHNRSQLMEVPQSNEPGPYLCETFLIPPWSKPHQNQSYIANYCPDLFAHSWILITPNSQPKLWTRNHRSTTGLRTTCQEKDILPRLKTRPGFRLLNQIYWYQHIKPFPTRHTPCQGLTCEPDSGSGAHCLLGWSSLVAAPGCDEPPWNDSSRPCCGWRTTRSSATSRTT